ncbi:hypothetical protein MCOR27_007060 [Pyricularia oryzae]|uniref:Checkpoint protein RAD24-like helical bundle domain-containing protein n=1 Tax=Pyricularia grisea TaxID=148305 RepID=A0ABQ8N7J7_PYRGI|nr:hypothetical protein MCOR26_010754 [Pyricularia oryzae]KAI6292555.1 hypothetical protein MCOR33_009767 [Pyricularia grisea]KAI6275250.1 hypothetical protein MCOR27_007060 [Pyricularia oryzae]KAI6315382.1 hypothetical protein MCOR29_006993 [Pyricularia oryzae]KAI6316642.1 hypothetical protein MCOR30_009243 [Pyricularia oryzae]
MAPPAKRRRRNLVQSDDEDQEPVQQKQPQQQASTPTKKNSLKNFLIVSPSPNSKPAGDATTSPSPTRKPTRPATTTTAAATTRSTRSGASSLSHGAAPPSFLAGPRSRGAGSRTSTKSPSTSPEKRTKRGGKIDEKGRTVDLVTLFSKQAQRVKTEGKPSASRPAPSSLLQDMTSDPISEDDDDVADHKAAVSSVVGRKASKRFRDGGGSVSSTSSSQQQQQQAPASSATSTTSQMFRKPTRPTTQAAAREDDDELRPWSERFGPANLDELAVHKRKVADVRRWLEDVMDGRMRQRLLILKGAAGSGKTTTLKLLARELKCEVLEWRNPTSSYSGPGQGYQSAAAQFEDFMGRGGKFGQLDFEEDDGMPSRAPPGGRRQTPPEGGGRRLMLVEEFPNTFMRSSSGLTSFRNAVLGFLASNTPSLAAVGQHTQREQQITPVVMIISETLLTTTSASADSFTAHRLLGPEILRHPGTGVIEFNAIAPTILSKALELVVQKEARKSGRRRTPGPQVLKRLGEIGDIRNAISSLEFLCLKGDQDADWGARVSFTKSKKGAKDLSLTKGERESLEMVSQREASLGIFHAVGKVVYNKRDDIPYPPGTEGDEAERLPNHMSHLSRPKQSLVQVDSLIDETGTDTSTFISAIHENYALSCESTGPNDPNSAVDYMNGCLDSLSDSDLLCPSWDIFFGGRGPNGSGGDLGSHVLRQDEMAFQLAVRGILFSLPSPVKRQSAGNPARGGGDSHKMFFPTSIKLWRAKEELEGLLDMWATRMLNGEDGPLGVGTASRGQQTLTNGATAFRKPKLGTQSTSSSVGDWATNRDTRQSSFSGRSTASTQSTDKKNDEGSATPLLSLGSSARKEMLLERLPYMAHMARRRRGSLPLMGLRDLEKVVSFNGIGNSSLAEDESAAEDEGEDDGGAQRAESWATDKPTDESSPRKKRAMAAIRPKKRTGSTSEGALQPSALQVQKLVLSDDDIEDD